MSPIMILTLKDRYPKTIISKAFLTCTHRNPITYFFYPEIRDNPISCTCQRLLKIKESKRIYNFYFWTLQKICSQKGWSLCIKCKKVHCKYNKGFFFSLFSLNWFGYCIPSIEFLHLILIGYLYAFLLVDGAHYTEQCRQVKSPLMLEFCHFHLKEAIPSLNKKCISLAIEPKEETRTNQENFRQQV